MKRRQFIVSTSLLMLSGCRPAPPPAPDSRLIRTLPFINEDAEVVGQLKGEGMDGILYTDLQATDPAHPLTPTEQFYVIRTVPAHDWPKTEGWAIQVHGQVGVPQTVGVDTLLRDRKPQGVHLMECSGNERQDGFRLLSAGDWEGVPLHELLTPLRCQKDALVKVSGLETPVQGWSQVPDDVPGAGWIFTQDQLQGAFLATHLNGDPLTPPHGQPVRLVVPGWYGCTHIKWVNDIELLPPDAKPTAHMSNYAEATHQHGDPQRARDFRPALITTSAIPIRVEEWRTGARTEYRIVGLVWGGPRPVQHLVIRFNEGDDYKPVDQYVPPADTRTWAFWHHRFTTDHPGTYRIQVAVDDDNLPTPRLSRGYCTRQFKI